METHANGTTALAKAPDYGAIVERVMIVGDVDKLTPSERVSYYRQTCQSLGLNPLTRPFEYIRLNGKLTLYARRDCTDQLRQIHRISVTITNRERSDDLYVVSARATTPDGRADEAIGAVVISGLKGENLANALMKAETKAKRRVTLSICGLGFSDETEVESIPGAARVEVTNDGEVVPGPKPMPPLSPAVVAAAPITGTTAPEYREPAPRRDGDPPEESTVTFSTSKIRSLKGEELKGRPLSSLRPEQLRAIASSLSWMADKDEIAGKKPEWIAEKRRNGELALAWASWLESQAASDATDLGNALDADGGEDPWGLHD